MTRSPNPPLCCASPLAWAALLALGVWLPISTGSAQAADPTDTCGERAFHIAHDGLRGYAYLLAHPHEGMGESETVTRTVAMARRMAQAFGLIEHCQNLVWAIRAWRDIGRVYDMAIEALADKVMPDSDLGRELACESTLAYLQAVRWGRMLAPGGYAPDESREALDALRSRSAAVIAQCVSARRRHDPMLPVFTAADLEPIP